MEKFAWKMKKELRYTILVISLMALSCVLQKHNFGKYK